MSFLHEPGDLAETPLAAVLLEALNLRATGVLAVEHGGGTSRLFFRAGRPVGAQVFAGFRPLGHMLLQAGLIDIDALSRSLATMAQSGRPQGEVLIEMGAVSREDVDRTLAEQQAGYFGLIAALERGVFRFDPSIEMPAWTRTTPLSPLRTIVDALERPQAGALVVSALQQVARSGAALAPGYADVEGSFRWTAAERALVSRLVRPVALDFFFAASEVPPERARAILAALVLLGLAIGAGERAAAAVGKDEIEAFDAGAARMEAWTPPPIAAAESKASGAASTRASATASAAPSSTPPHRGDPSEARVRRQRLLHKAMQNMGIGPFSGSARTPPAPSITPAPTAATPAPPGAAEDALRRALLAIAPRARERDLFARLGVPESATRDDVRKAFLALARQFHPDRFASAALKDLADTVRDFFTAVNEAYEVLSDDRRRAEHLARRAPGGGTPAPQAAAARVDFEKGEACLRTRDLVRARGFYEAAVRADPRPEYQAALAFVLVSDPQRKDRERARALLGEATRDASCDRAQYVAGLLARDDGDHGRAERLFRAATAANPRNADALRELRAVQALRAERGGR